MKKLYTTYLLMLILTATGFAQQDPQYSHSMFNQMAVNPGYAGMRSDINVTAIRRQQWLGLFDGVPTITLLTIDAAIKPFGVNSGVGLSIIDDQLGFYNKLNVKGIYSYRRRMLGGMVGIGIEIGFLNHALESEGWVFPETSEMGIAEKESKMVLDMGIGVSYQRDDLYIGISSTHIPETEIRYDADIHPYLSRHYFLAAAYNIQLPLPLFELKPFVLIKSDGASMQISANANVLYNKKIWFGVTYRNLDAITILAGIRLKNGIKFGYAYDITTTSLRKGSHEVMLNYEFNFLRNRGQKRYKSVRYL